MENIFSKMEANSGNVLEVDVKNPLDSPHVKTELLGNQDSQEQRLLSHEDVLKKEEDDIHQRSDSDDNEDANLDQAATALEDMLTKTEDFTSRSESAHDTKENIAQSLQGTSFESEIILPKLALCDRKEKKRESKSRKELEEEEREKMQYVLNKVP